MSATDDSTTAVIIVKRAELALSRSAPLARRGLQTLNDLDDAERCLSEGMRHKSVEEPEKALRCFLRGLDKSPLHGELHLQLSLIFRDGCGNPQDAQKEFWHMRMSAEAGHSWGQMGLAHLYQTGTGMPKDDQMAYLWMKRAAEQNNSWAEVALGEMFEMGIGVEQDDLQAAHWYLRAADHGGYVWRSRLTTLQLTIDGLIIIDVPIG